MQIQIHSELSGKFSLKTIFQWFMNLCLLDEEMAAIFG